MSEDDMKTTLTDFLMARIAEDESVAREAELKNTSGARVLYAARNVYLDEGPLGATGDVIATPARILAECEARHRIVERLAPIANERQVAWDLAEAVLKDMALPYADHVHYRADEWAP